MGLLLTNKQLKPFYSQVTVFHINWHDISCHFSHNISMYEPKCNVAIKSCIFPKPHGNLNNSYISYLHTQNNQQERFRLSNWFSLRCLGRWMTLASCVITWWSFKFMFINDSWYVSLTYSRGIFYWCLVLIIVCIHCPNFTFIIPLVWFHSELPFFYSKYYIPSFPTDIVSTLS